MTLPKKPLCVNRLAELDRVDALQATALAGGAPLLVALTGPQGIGKTVLAVSLGYRLARDFPDGVLFCDAHATDLQSACGADELARQLLVQLGFPWKDVPTAPGDRLSLLRNETAGKRLLIVLDDIRLAAQVEPLLGDLSHSAVIVTSRSRLKSLELNQQFTAVELPQFDEAAASALVTAIVGDLPGTVTREVLVKLCALCEGLPLALAAGAGMLGSGDEDPADFVDQLALGSALDELEVDGDLVVKTVFDAVYRDLDKAEQRAYRLLSLLAGPHFGSAAAAAALELPERAAKRVLAQLLRKNVVQDLGAGRYRYHLLVREHALGVAPELTGDEGDELIERERRRAILRADRWYARRAVALDRSFSGRPDPHGSGGLYTDVAPAFDGDDKAERAAAEFDLEWPNLLAAVRRCAEFHQDVLAIAMPVALCSFAYQSGRCGAVIDAYQRALAFATDEATHWQIYRDLAQLHERGGEHVETEKYARLAEAVYPQGRASAIEWRALAYEARGDLTTAAETLVDAVGAVPLMGKPSQEKRAYALLNMHAGRIGLARGLPEDARRDLGSARRYFADHPIDADNGARCDVLLGDIARAAGAAAEAGRYWISGAEVFERLRMWGPAIAVLKKLVHLAEEQGRTEDTEGYRSRIRDAENGQRDN
jgi:tetratricopeptide (TPR) repeat protein